LGGNPFPRSSRRGNPFLRVSQLIWAAGASSFGRLTMTANPAVQAFAESFEGEKLWAQVLIRRRGAGFELCHAADRDRPEEALRLLDLPALRELAAVNSAGQFRPLRSAPDLRAGWRARCADLTALDEALRELYPGSIPDWFAARQAAPPVTHYREFTNRQTGMYRTAQKLTDAQAGRVITAGCHARFCLKQRRWTVDGTSVDAPGTDKSEIPCLEPCAVLLELARKAARIEQEEAAGVQLPVSDLESMLAAVQLALVGELAGGRVGNVGSPANPRRLQLILEKYRPAAERAAGAELAESKE